MNAARKFVCLVTASLGLSACASVPMTAGAPAQGAGSGIDVEYVTSVERGARVRGTTVHWINPPREVDRDR